MSFVWIMPQLSRILFYSTLLPETIMTASVTIGVCAIHDPGQSGLFTNARVVMIFHALVFHTNASQYYIRYHFRSAQPGPQPRVHE